MGLELRSVVLSIQKVQHSKGEHWQRRGAVPVTEVLASGAQIPGLFTDSACSELDPGDLDQQEVAVARGWPGACRRILLLK